MGFSITAYVNATNFVDFQENGDDDWIMLRIVSIDHDLNLLSESKGVPEFFEILPCNDMSIPVTLNRSNLIDRFASPCRNDYPKELKSLLVSPMRPENLYNSILIPNLPYDKRICEELCIVNYWLPIVSCVMSYDILKYVRRTTYNNGNLSMCEFIWWRYRATPVGILDDCKCYNPCNGHEFVVSASDKICHNGGTSCSDIEKRVSFSSNINTFTHRMKVFNI